jgi:hypothetical protein
MARPVVNLTANSARLVIQLASSTIFAAVFFGTLSAAGFGLVNFCTLAISLGWQLTDLSGRGLPVREFARPALRHGGEANLLRFGARAAGDDNAARGRKSHWRNPPRSVMDRDQ